MIKEKNVKSYRSIMGAKEDFKTYAQASHSLFYDSTRNIIIRSYSRASQKHTQPTFQITFHGTFPLNLY